MSTVASSWDRLLLAARAAERVAPHAGRAQEDERTWREMLAQGARVCPVCGEANITVRGFCSDGCEFVHLSKKVEDFSPYM